MKPNKSIDGLTVRSAKKPATAKPQVAKKTTTPKPATKPTPKPAAPKKVEV